MPSKAQAHTTLVLMAMIQAIDGHALSDDQRPSARDDILEAWRCNNFSRPENRWFLFGKAPEHEPGQTTSILPDFARGLVVLFVGGNARSDCVTGACKHRCLDPASDLQLANARFMPCVQLTAKEAEKVDVFVHCKALCSTVLPRDVEARLTPYSVGNRAKKIALSKQARSRQIHLVDRVDWNHKLYDWNRNKSYGYSNPVDGEIFNTAEQMQQRCTSRVCVVIPHHFNLPCANASSRLQNGFSTRTRDTSKWTIGVVGSHTKEVRTNTSCRRTLLHNC